MAKRFWRWCGSSRTGFSRRVRPHGRADTGIAGGHVAPGAAALGAAQRPQAGEFKFRRQHPFEPYILDFYCPEKRLAIEVDGQGHDMGDNPQRDVRRDRFLKQHGIRVLRFRAEEVVRNMDGVVRTIAHELTY